MWQRYQGRGRENRFLSEPNRIVTHSFHWCLQWRCGQRIPPPKVWYTPWLYAVTIQKATAWTPPWNLQTSNTLNKLTSNNIGTCPTRGAVLYVEQIRRDIVTCLRLSTCWAHCVEPYLTFRSISDSCNPRGLLGWYSHPGLTWALLQRKLQKIRATRSEKLLSLFLARKIHYKPKLKLFRKSSTPNYDSKQTLQKLWSFLVLFSTYFMYADYLAARKVRSFRTMVCNLLFSRTPISNY